MQRYSFLFFICLLKISFSSGLKVGYFRIIKAILMLLNPIGDIGSKMINIATIFSIVYNNDVKSVETRFTNCSFCESRGGP